MHRSNYQGTIISEYKNGNITLKHRNDFNNRGISDILDALSWLDLDHYETVEITGQTVYKMFDYASQNIYQISEQDIDNYIKGMTIRLLATPINKTRLDDLLIRLGYNPLD